MNKKKTKRRLNYLISKYHKLPFGLKTIEEIEKFFNGFIKHEIYYDMLEIHDLFKKLKIENESDKIKYFTKQQYKTTIKKTIVDYNKSPKRECKDNKNFTHIFSYQGLCPRVRVPRKKRKTAWKRFHKIFPNIKINKRLNCLTN